MKIVVGSDHGGYAVKEAMKEFLQKLGHEVLDVGTDSDSSVDYPLYGERVARAVSSGKFERGLLCCGTGIGMSMTANKVPGIRAAVCHNAYTAEMSRRHNDANVLCLGGRVLSVEEAQEILRVWMEASFDGKRHERRVEKISRLDGSA